MPTEILTTYSPQQKACYASAAAVGRFSYGHMIYTYSLILANSHKQLLVR